MKKVAKKLVILFATLCIIFSGGCGEKNKTNEQDVEKEVIPFPEVTLTEEDLQNKFYYSQLETDAARLTYKDLYEGLKDRSEVLYAHTNSEIPVGSIVYSVLYDYPEIFWCDVETEVSYELIEGSEMNYMKVYPKYIYSPEEVEKMKIEIEEETRECIEKCSKKKTEYGKVKYVYEYLIDTVEYLDDAPNDQNAYSALVAKKTVCAGYARATQYLLEKSGVYCMCVIGATSDENGKQQGHAWNIVRCDGKYYFVDTTWGDPVYQNSNDSKKKKERNYDYLCCSETELFKTHIMGEQLKYPECKSEDLNYYRRNGMFYESFDEDEILNEMYKAVDNKDKTTIFKFQNEEDYLEATKALDDRLLEDTLYYLGNNYGIWGVNVSYSYSPVLWKVTIYWNYD